MGTHSPVIGAQRFRRAMAVTVSSLVVVCAVLGVLGALQGPRLSDVVVDTAAVTSLPDQQLRMFTDQVVADVDEADVTVTPDVDFTVAAADDVITLQFGERLLHDTEYSIEVSGVTSPYADRQSTLDHRFRTGPGVFYYLDRADPTVDPESLPVELRQDRIIRAQVTGPERTTAVSAAGIQDFAVLDEIIAVATVEPDETNAVTLVEPGSTEAERLTLPATGTIDLLEGSPAAGMLAFTFTSEEAADGAGQGAAPDESPDGISGYQENLFFIDLAGDHRVEPVVGIDGQPLRVLSWHFIPGTPRIVVQTFDLTLLVVDLSGAEPIVPLGSATDLGRVSPDGTAVAIGDVRGQFALDLADRTETPLLNAPVDGVVPFGGDIQLVGGEVGRIQQVAVFDDVTGRFSSHIVQQNGAASRVLYEKTDQVGSIDSFSVSPNGQYVAVTTVPDLAASVIDGYPIDPAFTSVTTILVDVASGAALGSVEGFTPTW